MKINLNNVKDITNFIKLCSTYDENITLHSDMYVINAKSIMGVYSLDLSKPIEVKIHTDNDDVLAKFLGEIVDYAA